MPMQVWKVTVTAPPINDEVVTAAETEDQAKQDAINSAFERWRVKVTTTAEPLPEDTPRTI